MGSERKNDQSNTWLRWALDADAALLQEIDGDSLTFDSCDCESAVQCTCAHLHRKLRVLVTRECEWVLGILANLVSCTKKGYSAVLHRCTRLVSSSASTIFSRRTATVSAAQRCAAQRSGAQRSAV